MAPHAGRAKSLRLGLPVALALTALLVPSTALAHVEYVAEGQAPRVDPWAFLVATVSEPANALLLGVGAVAALVAVAVALRVRRRMLDVRVLVRTLESYESLVPWMLRLSVGLPLVGAGFAGYLFSPTIPADYRLPQVLLGFLLLLGLATRAAAVLGLLGYLATVLFHGHEALLALEYIPGLLAIVLLGPGRPSADDMLERVASTRGTLYHRVDPVHRWAAGFQARVAGLMPYAATVVRVGLGVTFLYLGIAEKLLQPGLAVGVVQDLGLDALLPIDPRLWVIGAGGVEAILGLVLVLGFLTRASAALAFVVLTSTLLGLPDDPVLPHIALFGLSSVVFTLGAGPWSLDHRLALRSRRSLQGRSSVS